MNTRLTAALAAAAAIGLALSAFTAEAAQFRGGGGQIGGHAGGVASPGGRTGGLGGGRPGGLPVGALPGGAHAAFHAGGSGDGFRRGGFGRNGFGRGGFGRGGFGYYGWPGYFGYGYSDWSGYADASPGYDGASPGDYPQDPSAHNKYAGDVCPVLYHWNDRSHRWIRTRQC